MKSSELTRSLLRHSGLYLVALVIGQGLPLFLLPVVTRYLSPAEWGAVALAETIGFVVGVLALVGLQTAFQRLHFAADEHQRPIVQQAVLRAGLLSSVVVVAAAMLVGFVAFDGLFSGFSVSFYPLIAIGVVAGVARELTRLRLVSWQLDEQSRRWAVFSLIVAGLTAAGILVGVVGMRQGSLGYLGGKGLIELLAAAVAVAMLWKGVQNEPDLGDWMKRAVRFGAPLVPYQICAFVLIGADRFFLEHYRTLDEVGTYSVAYSLAGALTFAGGALLTAWSPRFYQRANQEERAHIARRMLFLMSLLSGAMLIGSVLAEPVAAVVLGDEFASAGALVPVIALGTLFHAWYAFFQLPILQKNRPALFVLITGSALALNLLLNVLLVPELGVLGAAIATGIAYTLEVAFAWWISRRLLPLPLPAGSVILQALVCTAMVVLLHYRGQLAVWVVALATAMALALVFYSSKPKEDSA